MGGGISVALLHNLKLIATKLDKAFRRVHHDGLRY